MVIVVIGGGSRDEQRLARLVAATGLHVECRHAESQDVPASALASQDVAGTSL